MIEQVLEEIGLRKSEIKVYLSLLELGTSSVGKIATKSKTATSKIYDTLDKLIEKGLVSYIVESGIKVFSATEPKQILDFLEEKEKNINLLREKVEKIIPVLENKMQLRKYKADATIYKGMKALRFVFNQSYEPLKSGEEVLVMGIPERSYEANIFFLACKRELAKRGVKMREIISEKARGELQTKIGNMKNIKIRYVNEDLASATAIVRDRVIIFPKEILEPILFVIDNKEVAQSYRIQFEQLWRKIV